MTCPLPIPRIATPTRYGPVLPNAHKKPPLARANRHKTALHPLVVTAHRSHEQPASR
jgi:hypothetical protein